MPDLGQMLFPDTGKVGRGMREERRGGRRGSGAGAELCLRVGAGVMLRLASLPSPTGTHRMRVPRGRSRELASPHRGVPWRREGEELAPISG